jgi:hypothetical protein
LTLLNRNAEAIGVFQKLIDSHPELPGPYNNLAVLYGNQGEYEKARQALELAIRTNPAYATAFQNLGDAVALQFFALAFGPGVHHKGAAVFVGNGGCQAGLQPEKVCADGINKGAHSGLRQRAVELPCSLRRAVRTRTATMKSYVPANSEWQTAAWR